MTRRSLQNKAGKPPTYAWRLIACVCACAAAWSVPVLAANLGFLKDSPYFAQFTEEDRNIFHDALEHALNETKMKVPHHWKNPKTGAKGEIVVQQALAAPNNACRYVRVTNEAKARVGKGSYVFCRKPDGSWAFDPSKGPSAK